MALNFALERAAPTKGDEDVEEVGVPKKRMQGERIERRADRSLLISWRNRSDRAAHCRSTGHDATPH